MGVCEVCEGEITLNYYFQIRTLQPDLLATALCKEVIAINYYYSYCVIFLRPSGYTERPGLYMEHCITLSPRLATIYGTLYQAKPQASHYNTRTGDYIIRPTNMAPPVLVVMYTWLHQCVVAVMVRQTPPHAWLTPQTKQPLLIGKPVLMDLLSQPRARELIRTPS